MPATFYEQAKTCPACGRRFMLTRPRTAACVVLKRDTDFRVQCAGVDPNLYSVWVCPRCGYAASETTFEHLEEKERPSVQQALVNRPIPPEAQGERTTAGAVAAYEQAIYLGELRKLSPSYLAGLHLKLAWVYRSLGDEGHEQEHLTLARDLYRTAFNRERLGGSGKMSEATVGYLIGELCRRTGAYAEAINWFSRLVSDPRTKKEPQILNLSREQWYAARRQASGEETDEAVATAPEAATVPPAVAAPPAPAGPPVTVRSREGRVSTMVPLYRDQAEWLQQVVVNADPGARLTLADVIRAVLDVAIQETPTAQLKAANEAELREKLIAWFTRGKEERTP